MQFIKKPVINIYFYSKKIQFYFLESQIMVIHTHAHTRTHAHAHTEIWEQRPTSHQLVLVSPSPWLPGWPEDKHTLPATKEHTLLVPRFPFSAPTDAVCGSGCHRHAGHIFKGKAITTIPNQKTKNQSHLPTSAHDITVELSVVNFVKIINAY